MVMAFQATLKSSCTDPFTTIVFHANQASSEIDALIVMF